MSIRLLPEHEDLLAKMVEAHRAVPRDKRERFMELAYLGLGTFLRHRGFLDQQLNVFEGDVAELARTGMIAEAYRGRHNTNYDITTRGFEYYSWMKSRSGQPAQQIEKDTREYLDSSGFAKRHPEASQKWQKAASLLWNSDSRSEFTAIGHHCRESIQMFITDLVDTHNPHAVPADAQKTVARFKGVLDVAGNSLGTIEREFLDALLNYWGSLQDLIQRQTHGATREQESLTWEDARRVVFQTAVVMFEIDRSLAK